jgi:general secretion pathway protein L
MLDREEAGMQVSNILSLLKTRQFEFDNLAIRLDPFLELASGIYQEIYLEKGKYTLAEKSRASWPIARDDSNTFSSIDDLIANSRSSRKTILSVSLDLCFQLSSQFPVSARSKVNQLSQLELQRATPFALADVYNGCIVVGENETTVFTQQFVLKKIIVTEIQQQLLQHKKPIEAVFIRDISGKAIELAFSPNGEFFGHQHFKKWKKNLGLSFGMFAIGSAVLLAGIHSFHAKQYEVISSATENLQPEIKKVKQVLESSEKRNTSIMAMQKLQVESVSRLAVIEEVTRVLPDTAYLLNLSIVDNRILLEGSANSPEKLIPVFESSSFFKNVAFGSAVFNSPGETQSHFAINMDLEQSK